MGGGGLFARFGSNCCDTPAEPCAEADPCQDSCGCRLLSGGLLSGLFNRNCGCAAPCETAEPSEQPAADCCDPCCRSGRLRNLMSRIRNINLFNRGNGCCETEQADPCASDCCGGGFNLMGRVRGMVAGMVGNRGCGCEAAPACEADPCGCASRTGLLDRLRGRLASRGCCDPCCGNGSDAAGEETPQPDSDNKVEGSAANLAPIVDPSAFSIRGGIVETLN